MAATILDGNNDSYESSLQKLRALVQSGILPPYADQVADLILPSIRLRTTRTPDDDIPIGATKFGGLPDLPVGAVWPKETGTGKHIPFLAQINLHEVEAFDRSHTLPRNGILFFFYNGYDDSVAETSVIQYSGSSASLKRHTLPNSLVRPRRTSWWQKIFTKRHPPSPFLSCCVTLSIEVTCPWWESFYLERIATDEMAPIDAYTEEFLDGYTDMHGGSDRVHRLLGYPDGIQGSGFEAHFVESILEREELTPKDFDMLLEWKLLLQIDSDCAMGTMWGDLGRVYFFIREQDLSAGNFSKVRVTGDCY